MKLAETIERIINDGCNGLLLPDPVKPEKAAYR